MANRSHTNLSIIEAVETLSSIADLEFERDIGVAQKHEIILDNEKVAYKTVHWLHEKDANATVHLVKETFRVILHYLRQFYKKEYGYVTDPKTIEGIKTIMVLVGEAAKKLDRYTQVFHLAHNKSVTEFKEYKQLQEFYLSKIARKIDEGTLGKWILGLSLGKVTKERTAKLAAADKRTSDTKYVFVDLETVKKDTEYELFFIRKEDGSRFFSPRLLRNIKLVCDFGSYFGEHRGTDPLEHVNVWLDKVMHTNARNIIKYMGAKLDHYCHDVRKVKDHELVEIVNKALFALMLSSHSSNLLRHRPVKCCAEYFEDFQSFLRDALQSRMYQKWIAYPPKESNHLAHDLFDLIHSLCRAVFVSLQGMDEMIPIIHELIKEAHHQVSKEHLEEAHGSKQLWNRIAGDYAAMTKLMKRHPNGPLLKVLSILEEDAYHVFDPLLQHNIPNLLFDLYVNEERIVHFRMPAPIHQEVIHKAYVDEEFKGFLRFCAEQKEKKKMLLINFQDRTSWREHTRCAVLEALQQQDAFQNVFTVVTLAADTDFYHQLTPYHQVNHASTFIEQFKEHLKGEGSGFYFPSSLSKKELHKFIDQTIEIIHRVFFSNKNVLLREHRLDFIEIFYLFLILKILDWTQPNFFSFTCKDGIDIGESYSAELFAFLKLVNPEGYAEQDIDYLNFILYAPALLIRERLLLPERFNRTLSAMRTLENARDELGVDVFQKNLQEAFGTLFNTPLLTATLTH